MQASGHNVTYTPNTAQTARMYTSLAYELAIAKLSLFTYQFNTSVYGRSGIFTKQMLGLTCDMLSLKTLSSIVTKDERERIYTFDHNMAMCMSTRSDDSVVALLCEDGE